MENAELLDVRAADYENRPRGEDNVKPSILCHDSVGRKSNERMYRLFHSVFMHQTALGRVGWTRADVGRSHC